jgi:hypothetical protein
METAVYTEPLESYAQFYDPWAADDRFSPATAAAAAATMKKSGTAMSGLVFLLSIIIIIVFVSSFELYSSILP